MTVEQAVRFQRANFVVADVDRALTFYRDVLGFELTFRKGHNPESYSIPVFAIPDGAELDFAILSLPGQPRIMALSGIGKITLEPAPHPRRSAIVLDVADPDKVMADSAALGLKVYEEGRLETHDGRIGREIGIVDFDDNLVVIYRIPDAQ
ncbi:VOC family protein [Sphingorhabdus sp. SMR4y]|uniref:VOC family protein n=1 Tax=Sphingorhabdus sp. SMR4y TaxID=2584094 RepID=UPI000B5E7CB4|nr:VOC family protein [Sphingorhabdus sp. SMR4y]ASK88892.1 glyoxalase/bleomycin resistance/dioxygenase family protein [Sphingorhabdus sp. SMR4y]